MRLNLKIGVEGCLEGFDVAIYNSGLDYKDCLDNSVKAIKRIVYDAGFLGFFR